jgi:hypothetical protein
MVHWQRSKGPHALLDCMGYIEVCIPLEGDPEIWSKHVVGKNRHC